MWLLNSYICVNIVQLAKNYHKSDIEILIATMNRNSFDFLEKLFPFHDFTQLNIVIVNQTLETKCLVSKFDNIKVVNVFENGLSKSRNLALLNASKDLLIFTDDDVVFTSDFDEKIINAFSLNPNHVGFRFRFEIDENGKTSKEYPKKFQENLNWFEVLNTSSVEMVFKRESVQNQFYFDEQFGLGALFSIGEEAVFISDIIKNKYKVGFFPETILWHKDLTTSKKSNVWMNYYNQSAVFYRIFNKKYLLWVVMKLVFDLKQGKIKLLDILPLYKQAIKGKQKYVEYTRL